MVKQIDRDAAEAREILDTRRPGEGRDPVLASGTTTGFRPSPE
jgi:hypothetical protein